MEKKLGTVRIAPNVLATIAKLTALAIPGIVDVRDRGARAQVSRFRSFLGRQDRRWANEGVHIAVTDDTATGTAAVSVDLYIVVEHGKNMLNLSREIQLQVTRAINDMVGMPVKEVNIQILDVASGA